VGPRKLVILMSWLYTQWISSFLIWWRDDSATEWLISHHNFFIQSPVMNSFLPCYIG
jgi:hypothetical protein